MPESKGALVLAGGGVDSTTCIHQLIREGFRVRALHVDYGQRASTQEWAAVRRVATKLGIADLQAKILPGILYRGGELVGRNTALIALALLHLRPDEGLICIGVHAGTPFFDCSPAYVASIARLVAEQTDSKVRLVAPLLDLLKPAVVERARHLGVDLSETYSCQHGDAAPCRSCHSCLDREATGC
jgi:7-cyano-7-deazaguanine synthase